MGAGGSRTPSSSRSMPKRKPIWPASSAGPPCTCPERRTSRPTRSATRRSIGRRLADPAQWSSGPRPSGPSLRLGLVDRRLERALVGGARVRGARDRVDRRGLSGQRLGSEDWGGSLGDLLGARIGGGRLARADVGGLAARENEANLDRAVLHLHGRAVERSRQAFRRGGRRWRSGGRRRVRGWIWRRGCRPGRRVGRVRHAGRWGSGLGIFFPRFGLVW